MLESREKMAQFCRQAEQLVSGKFLFAGMAPRCCTNFNNYSRFLFCLDGRKHVRYGDGKRELTAFLEPGDVIFVPGCGQEEELWDSPHEMISCVFMRSFTRVIHIVHSGNAKEHAAPDVFFHLPKEEIAGDAKTADVIMELKQKNPEISITLMKTLLKLLYTSLESPDPSGERDAAWNKVCEAMHNLFRGDISREDVAELSGITPSMLSRLILKHTGKSFREFLNDHRLEHALSLLRQTALPVGEISLLSGFSYPSYFIRLFRARCGSSPELFRKNHFVLPDPEEKLRKQQ